MKKIFGVALAAVLAFGLSCCVGSSSEGSSTLSEIVGDFQETSVKLSDGRTVNCLFWKSGGYTSGMSCDWANAR